MSTPTSGGVKAEVEGHETEILDQLGIRWREGKPYIRCPYLAHLDRHASWRWDSEKRVAFCTCSDRPNSIFDVIIRVEGSDFARAADLAAVRQAVGEIDSVIDTHADLLFEGGAELVIRLAERNYPPMAEVRPPAKRFTPCPDEF